MTIAQRISDCLAETIIIRKQYPQITNVRYELYDIPYEDLKQFALTKRATLHTNIEQKRAYVIYSPMNVNNQMDTDIWLYSTHVKIKPAEIISE